jgi:hypothetical protein
MLLDEYRNLQSPNDIDKLERGLWLTRSFQYYVHAVAHRMVEFIIVDWPF